MQIFNFRESHVTTFRHPSGAYTCQMPGHRFFRLQQKAHLQSLCFPSVPLVLSKTVSRRLCAGQLKGTQKREKCCFMDLAPPTLQHSDFSRQYPCIATSTLTVCRRNRGDPSSLYRTQGALQVLHSRSSLAWSRPRADRGLSHPTSVFRTTISVCKMLSRSAEIWQYEGHKPVLE